MPTPKKKISLKLILFILSQLIILAVICFSLNLRRDRLQISYLNPQYGHAFLLNQGDRQMLFGTGNDSRINEFLGKNMPFFDRHLDFLYLLSPKKKYIGGAKYLLERVTLEKVVTHTTQYQSSLFRNFWTTAQETRASTSLLRDSLTSDHLYLEKIFSDDKRGELILRINFANQKKIIFSNTSPRHQEEVLDSDRDLVADLVIYDGELSEKFYLSTGARDRVSLGE